MIDYMQNHRIDALERALAALTNAGPVTFSPQPNNLPVPVSRAATDVQQNIRIESLESSVLALMNSVTLLNQQIASLTVELQRQTNAANMINLNPARTVDASQNERLDGIDSMVQSLTRDVSEYNQQMVELIAQFGSLRQQQAETRSPGSAKASWL